MILGITLFSTSIFIIAFGLSYAMELGLKESIKFTSIMTLTITIGSLLMFNGLTLMFGE
jgi:hypothetical protein